MVLKVLPKKMFSNCKILIPGKIFVSADPDLSTADVPHLSWEVWVPLRTFDCYLLPNEVIQSFFASQFSPRRWLYYYLIYISTHWELVPGPAFRSYDAAGDVTWWFPDQLRASHEALLPCSVQQMHAKHIMLIKTYCTSGCLHLDVFISF